MRSPSCRQREYIPRADHVDPGTGPPPLCDSLCLIEALRVRRYGNVIDAHTYRHVADMHHAATTISVDGTRVAYQVHSILNHDLAERVTMLSLAGFSFEEPAVASHLKKDEASLGGVGNSFSSANIISQG